LGQSGWDDRADVSFQLVEKAFRRACALFLATVGCYQARGPHKLELKHSVAPRDLDTLWPTIGALGPCEHELIPEGDAAMRFVVPADRDTLNLRRR